MCFAAFSTTVVSPRCTASTNWGIGPAHQIFNEFGNDPAHQILIVFGDANCLTDVDGGLKQFVKNGGALFLATDRTLYGQAETYLRNTAGVTVAGRSMVCLDTKILATAR